MHTQEEAQRRWRDLLPLLTEKQRGMLGSAWGHHVDVRLGRDEIDWACKRLREEWEKEETGKTLLCRSCGERMPCSGTDFDIMDQGRCLNVPWMYCPGCGDRYQGVGPGVCSICRTRMRVWKDPHRRPPPADVTKIDKRGTGM